LNQSDQIIALTSNDDDNIEDKGFVIPSLSGFTNEFIDKIKIINTSILSILIKTL
jgi:hypothetical protein